MSAIFVALAFLPTRCKAVGRLRDGLLFILEAGTKGAAERMSARTEEKIFTPNGAGCDIIASSLLSEYLRPLRENTAGSTFLADKIWVVVQVEIMGHLHQKGIFTLEAQRRKGSTQGCIIQLLRGLLGVFAPLRETAFFFTPPETEPLS